MCLAVPMRLLERSGFDGTVELGGVTRRISLMLEPEAQVGDYLLVHAGYAIATVDEEEARENLALLAEMAERSEDGT